MVSPAVITTREIRTCRQWYIWPCVALGALAGNAAHAEPLAIRDLNPLLAGFELPAALSSTGLSPGSTRLDLQFDVANTSLEQANADEHLVVDAEVRRWQLTFNHALNERFSVAVELPYQSVGGGTLDAFIEDFHRSFGFPNGNRANWPRNRLWVDITEHGYTAFQSSRDSSGIGDISLRGGWHFDRNQQHTASLWLGIKLPTGDTAQLTGSGATDVALSIAAEQALGHSFHSYQQASLSWLGHGDRLATQQRTHAWNGTLGMDWDWTSHLSLLAQLDAHSRVYDSDLRLLGESVQLSFGPRYRTTHWQTTLTMSEDVLVDTAPDVQFQLRVGYAY